MGARSARYALLIAAQAVVILTALFFAGCTGERSDGVSIAGDWDYYRMLGAAANGGFEARRRFGFAHFDGPTAEGSWLRRRSGERLESISGVSLTGTDLVLSLGADRQIRAQVEGDTITGRIFRGEQPLDRVWLTRRTSAPAWEPYHPLWPGPLSEPTFAVHIDPAVPMTARDGATLMNFPGPLAMAPSAWCWSVRPTSGPTGRTASSGRRAATST